jgi:SPP1 family phage portal protein
MITRDKALLVGGAPTQELLRSVIKEFQNDASRRDRLLKYYQREHDICNRTRAAGLPNNKLVHDFPGYIVSMATGYLVGNAVGYSDEKQEEALRGVLEAYKRDSVDSVDSEIATDASVFGVGVEICYAGQDSKPHTSKLDRRNAFVVYDDTVEHTPLFGVQWMSTVKADGTANGFKAWVYTPTSRIPYQGSTIESLAETGAVEAHYFGIVPIVEYWNNPRESGDFEPVMTLIDAYDGLQSDRINDKQQFVDALLILYGVSGLQDSEDPEDERTAGQRIHDEGVLQFPEADKGKAEWLTKQLTESDVEVLKDAVKSDIHKFSMVPDLTDQEFAGNSSGVAMKFKLLGLEQLTKTKERWFREGLRWRLRLFSNFLGVKGASRLDADTVSMTFTRSLPVNDLEIAQTVQTLQGIVPDEILLKQVPWVSDVKEALAMLEKQKAEAAKAQQEAFGAYPGQGNAKDDPNDEGGAE